jgi:hypothetical protein
MSIGEMSETGTDFEKQMLKTGCCIEEPKCLRPTSTSRRTVWDVEGHSRLGGQEYPTRCCSVVLVSLASQQRFRIDLASRTCIMHSFSRSQPSLLSRKFLSKSIHNSFPIIARKESHVYHEKRKEISTSSSTRMTVHALPNLPAHKIHISPCHRALAAPRAFRQHHALTQNSKYHVFIVIAHPYFGADYFFQEWRMAEFWEGSQGWRGCGGVERGCMLEVKKLVMGVLHHLGIYSCFGSSRFWQCVGMGNQDFDALGSSLGILGGQGISTNTDK